jgi:hypothetical protein
MSLCAERCACSCPRFPHRPAAVACDNDAGVFSSETMGMDKQFSTQRDSIDERSARSLDADSARGPTPGLVLLFTVGQATCTVMPLPAGGLELGRGLLPDGLPADPKMSRRHASVRFDGERFCIEDHGSQNGTARRRVCCGRGTACFCSAVTRGAIGGWGWFVAMGW